MTDGRYRIGQAAEQAGVTTRTLRYYQELGLLSPATSPGGTRIYTEREVDRLKRIIELRDVMGLDLERIGVILQAEDRLDELRTEARRGPTQRRRRELIGEAIEINAEMREQVGAKLLTMQAYLDELEANALRYRTLLDELDTPVA